MNELLMLNGAFGVGKTTVAKVLCKTVRGAHLSDPETIGYVLRRLPAFFPGSTKNLEDYQDSALWRGLTVRFGVHIARRHRLAVMPMLFVKREYLAEVRSGFVRAGVNVHHVCLTARESTLEARLAARGLDPLSDEGRWVYPRARDACRTHRDAEFGVHIPTDGIPPERVALDILAHVGIHA